MKPNIDIGELEIGSAGACGGDQFGKDGLTEVYVDGKFWGLVHWQPGMRFCLQWNNGNGYHDLGWRKSRETARRAAIRAVDDHLTRAAH